MSSTQQQQLCYSRLGAFCLRNVENCKLRGLVAALVVNDLGAARTILSKTLAAADFNHRVCTPFGGYRVFPAEAVVSGPASEDEKGELISQLHGLGASLNISWRDTSGEHTPLSKALSLRQFRLADTLVTLGASPATALLETSLLAACRFDPAVVKWLLDAGADVTVPAHHSPRHCPSGSSGSSSALVAVLGKCGEELRVLRNLSSLQVMPATELQQQQTLLQRTAQMLMLLLAAGAPPFPWHSATRASTTIPAREAGGANGQSWMPPLASPYQPQLQPVAPQQQAVQSSSSLGYHLLMPEAGAPSEVCGREPTATATSHDRASPTLSPPTAARGGPPAAEAACQLSLPRLHSWQPCTGAAGSPKLAQQPQHRQQAQQQHESDWPVDLPSLDGLQLGAGCVHPAAASAGCPDPPLGLSEAEWNYLCPFATQVPHWSRRQHHLFPRPLRLAVQQMLLIARCRGFPAAATEQLRLGGLQEAPQRLPQAVAEIQAVAPQAAPSPAAAQEGGCAEARHAQRPGRGQDRQRELLERRQVEHAQVVVKSQDVMMREAPQGEGGEQFEVQQQQEAGQWTPCTCAVWLDDNVLDCVFRHLARVYYH